MRFGQSFTAKFLSALFIIAFQQVFPWTSSHASSTNVFLAKNGLKGTGATPDGIRPFNLKGDSRLILGTNAPNSDLAIAVHDVDCTPNGVHPRIRLVAFNRNTNKIVAPLVEFFELNQVYQGEGQILMHAHGIGLSGVEGADMDALITFNYEPCTSSNSPTAPRSVSIAPMGTIKPSGTPPYNAAISSDEGFIVLNTEDPNHPQLTVSVSGSGANPEPTCNITLNTTSLNYSNVLVGDTATLTVVVRNNGALACTVNSIQINGSTAFASGSPGTPFNVVPGGSVSFPVTFTPVASGADSAVLRVTSTDPDAAQQFITLSGNGTSTTDCNINASPLLLAFGSVEIGTNKTLSVTVTNSGGSTCEIDNLTFLTNSPDFFLDAPTLPIPVPPGTSVVLNVTYTPSGATGASGTLEIDNGDPAHRLILVSVTATGVAATCALQIGPTSLDFGAVIIGTNRDLSVSITNNSLATCTINSITPSGSPEFTLDPLVTTPFNVLAGQNTNITFTFTPTGGPATNTFTINATSGNTAITLTGVGAVISSNCTIFVSKTELAYGDVATGSTNILKFQVSNTSTSPCSIQNLILSGSTDFTVIAPPLPIELPGAATVEIGVRYLPLTPGADIGNLDIVNSDPLQQVASVSLIGTGVQALVSISTNVLDFGAVVVGTNATLAATITNTNVVNATIRSITKSGSGDFILDPFVPTSQFFLTPGATVQIPVMYLPSDQGLDTGTITVQSDAFGAPFNISLVGTGLLCNLSITPTSLTFGKAPIGSTNTLSFTVNNTGNMDCGVESVEFFGSGRFTINPTAPFSVGAGSPVHVDVQYLPINVQTVLILGGTVKTSGNPTIVIP